MSAETPTLAGMLSGGRTAFGNTAPLPYHRQEIPEWRTTVNPANGTGNTASPSFSGSTAPGAYEPPKPWPALQQAPSSAPMASPSAPPTNGQVRFMQEPDRPQWRRDSGIPAIPPIPAISSIGTVGDTMQQLRAEAERIAAPKFISADAVAAQRRLALSQVDPTLSKILTGLVSAPPTKGG